MILWCSKNRNYEDKNISGFLKKSMKKQKKAEIVMYVVCTDVYIFLLENFYKPRFVYLVSVCKCGIITCIGINLGTDLSICLLTSSPAFKTI